MISDRAIDGLENNRKRRLRGDIIAIPWSFKKLSKIVPGIEKGRYFMITANPKSGKSQLCDFLFVFEPVEWFINNNPKNLKLKIFYFSLEMSKESKILQAISYKLNKDYGISIAPQHLRSTFESYILNDDILKILRSKDFQLWLKRFEEIVTYIDDIRSPNAIHSYIKHYAEKHGKYIYKDEEHKYIEDYIPDHDNEYVMIICDHLSLLTPENGDTLHGAMYKYSAYHCLEFRDRFKYIPVNVQQQSADSAKQQFDYKGNSVVEKIRPSPDGLADCRLTVRDTDLMLSLFHPAAYNLEEYEGIDLKRIGTWHRELFVNVNRNGLANVQIQLYFNGAVNEFMELPRPVDDVTYKLIQNKVNKLIV